MRQKIYFDIETVPSCDEWVLNAVKENTKPPASYKKQETIDKWFREKYDEEFTKNHQKCALKGATNQAIYIGAALDDGEIFSFCGDDEPEVLGEFNDFIDKNTDYPIFIGHNIYGFDLKIIKQRMMVKSVLPCSGLAAALDAKPWDKCIYDTMLKWDSKDYVSLDTLAKAFGLDGKSGSGADVYPMYCKGDWAGIESYGKQDVSVTREVAKKMMKIV